MWDRKQARELCRLWVAGWCVECIALHVGREAKWITRNTVIGMAQVLGLPRRPPGGEPLATEEEFKVWWRDASGRDTPDWVWRVRWRFDRPRRRYAKQERIRRGGVRYALHAARAREAFKDREAASSH